MYLNAFSYDNDSVMVILLLKKVKGLVLLAQLSMKLSGVSHYTMTQMGKDKDVSTEALRNICFALDCKLDDIMEFIPDDSEQTQ